MSAGWECPKCGASLAPHMEFCPCSPPQTRLRLDIPPALPFPGNRIVVAAAPQIDLLTATADRNDRNSNDVAGVVLGLGSKTSTTEPRRRNDYEDPDFGRFWEVYPVRRDKLAAYKAWMRDVVAAAVDVEAVIAAAVRYRDAAYRDPLHSKYAQGWLSGRRWEDEVDVAVPASAELAATDWDAERAAVDARLAADLAAEEETA